VTEGIAEDGSKMSDVVEKEMGMMVTSVLKL
jgi:hypothetical protein